ncbi:MAG: TraB/GumN family protein [Methanobacterium sp.]|nr:TraB/GumN family protein [Methanobacterium sp.]
MAPENLKLIGTAHVSKESIEEVKAAIIENQPEVVAVELDLNRFQNMMAERNGQVKQDINLREIIKGDKLSIFLVSMFLSYMQRKIGDKLGVKPGSEMLAAVDAAEEIGANVALIDRDISLTLKRAIDKMSWIEKAKFLYGIIASFFSSEEIDDVESIKDGDELTEVMEYFKEMSPKAYDVLVSERDAYMSHRLLEINNQSVVAVVGAGHKKGITRYMEHPEELPPIEDLLTLKKSRIPIGKLILYSIPLIFIIIFALAILHGINIQTSIINFILLTGTFSFLGCILSGSKIYSAITAFIVAPLTTIHPLLAAGWFSGIVEAKMRHISMDDAVEISKVDSFRELWGNNLFRVLLVVVGTNIGATIGLLLTLPYVILPLIYKIWAIILFYLNYIFHLL